MRQDLLYLSLSLRCSLEFKEGCPKHPLDDLPLEVSDTLIALLQLTKDVLYQEPVHFRCLKQVYILS